MRPTIRLTLFGRWISIAWDGLKCRKMWGVKDLDKELVRLWLGPITIISGRTKS